MSDRRAADDRVKLIVEDRCDLNVAVLRKKIAWFDSSVSSPSVVVELSCRLRLQDKGEDGDGRRPVDHLAWPLLCGGSDICFVTIERATHPQ